MSLTVHESIQLVGGDVDRRLGLAEERNDGFARVSSDDGDGGLCRVLLADDGGHEGLGTNNIEGGDTEEALGVEDAGALEHLGGNGHRRVDGVGDDQHESLGAVLGNALDEALHDAGIDLEKIVTGHARLA